MSEIDQKSALQAGALGGCGADKDCVEIRPDTPWGGDQEPTIFGRARAAARHGQQVVLQKLKNLKGNVTRQR